MQNHTNIPDLTQFDEFKEIHEVTQDKLNDLAKKGWSVLSIGVNRPQPHPDGSFIDGFSALLGRNPRAQSASQYR